MKNISAQLIVTLIFTFLCSISFGQITFQKTFWNPDTITTHYGHSVVQLNDEGYIIAGTSVDPGMGVLKRVDKYGNEIWNKYYSTVGQNDLEFSNIQITADNNLIVTGVVNYGSSDSRHYDSYLAKFDTLGNLLWERNYGGNFRQWTRQVKQTFDNGYILCGYNEIIGTAGSTSFYLIKTDNNGDTLWTRTYYNGSQQDGQAVEQTIDSGFVLVGRSNSIAYIIKTNNLGDTIWTKYLSELTSSGAYDVANAANGNIVVSGYSQFNGCSQPFLLEIDLNGSIQWDEIYEDGPCGWGYSVIKTNDDGYAVFGMDAGYRAYLIKTDSVGDQQWYKKFDENTFDYGYSVRQTTDNGFIMTGITSNSNKPNILLIKTDGKGDILNVNEIQPDDNFVIYPNPAMNEINIVIPENIAARDLILFNSIGQIIIQRDISSLDHVNLDISNLTSGIYLVKIDDMRTAKIIKH